MHVCGDGEKSGNDGEDCNHSCAIFQLSVDLRDHDIRAARVLTGSGLHLCRCFYQVPTVCFGNSGNLNGLSFCSNVWSVVRCSGVSGSPLRAYKLASGWQSGVPTISSHGSIFCCLCHPRRPLHFDPFRAMLSHP